MISSKCNQRATSASVIVHRNGAWSDPFPNCDSDRTLLLVFGAPATAKAPAPFEQLRNAFPLAHVIGCSTAGEIVDGSLADDSIVAAVFPFVHTRLKSVSAPISKGGDSFEAGQSIAGELAGPSLRAILVFSDGLCVNGSELVRGLNSKVPPDVVITGGLAADGSRFEQTWTLGSGLPQEGYITAVGLYGDHVRVGHGSKGGWDVFGPERCVTRSASNILYEFDGQPALALYKKYLGELANELPASALLFPLSLRCDAESGQRLVRTILSVDEAEQSLTFAGDVPEGSLGQFMRANFDRLIDGAGESAIMARGSAEDEWPCLAIAVSCVGRRLVLGERAEEELERTMEMLPLGSHQVGFYSYGEISPLCTGTCELHNQTMTMTTIYEIQE